MLEAPKDDGDLSLMFTKDGGHGISTRLNFYVQRLQSDIHSWLFKTIKDHGGKVSNEHKSIVPKRGYILIDPGSSRGQDLAAKYPSNPSRPRWVVSWTFVTACLQAKKVLDPAPFAEVKPLFLDPDHNSVLSIYIHSKIRGKDRKALAVRIATHGGIIVNIMKNARVILCPPSDPKQADLRKRYSDPAKIAIEPPSWVTDCIEAGAVSFSHYEVGDSVLVFLRRRRGPAPCRSLRKEPPACRIPRRQLWSSRSKKSFDPGVYQNSHGK
ncbi:hypothetical protein BS47DRAFT_236282 [Hydnum rufescens UP504]|uniref:BRCT domain-containing protein n=1 Tax=Hydnum rufescens UP504 TaxID=1448309 RepID=A0A9P6AM14_9AGAM|nr:hypothetical protein BS47DRAFT_236282 [Hydnum rufescens UP504]